MNYDISKFISIKGNILFLYKGIFNVNNMSSWIDMLLEKYHDHADLQRVFKSILVELCHNVILYSKEKITIMDNAYSIGLLMIKEDKNKIKVTSGNLIKKEEVEALSNKCEIINEMTPEELRNFKRKQRGIKTDHNGGNIGLIKMALLSENKIDYNYKKINNNYYFYSITINLNK